jgi:predicted Zn-dependent protease
MDVFKQLAKYTRIQMIKVPAPDTLGHNIVKKAEAKAYDKERDQVNHYILGAEVDRESTAVPIILIEKDLFKPGVNWCYGGVSTTMDRHAYLALSTHRLKNRELFGHLLLHELGHLYGAAPRGRVNTIDFHGPHCTNPCIMQQKNSEEEMKQHAELVSTLEHKFCSECQSDLKRASIEWRDIR